jgi:hypothetical protein
MIALALVSLFAVLPPPRTISITSARFLAAFLAPKVQYFRAPTR